MSTVDEVSEFDVVTMLRHQGFCNRDTRVKVFLLSGVQVGLNRKAQLPGCREGDEISRLTFPACYRVGDVLYPSVGDIITWIRRR